MKTEPRTLMLRPLVMMVYEATKVMALTPRPTPEPTPAPATKKQRKPLVRTTAEQRQEIVRRVLAGEDKASVAKAFGISGTSVSVYVGERNEALCRGCRLFVPLDEFGILKTSRGQMRDGYCVSCRVVKPVASEGMNKPQTRAPTPKYEGELAGDRHASMLTMERAPRADGRLCAHDELDLRGPVPRPGSASPRLEQIIKNFGGR